MTVSTGELVEMLARTSHRLRRASSKVLAPLSLTPAQVRTLRLVARSTEPVRMGELAEWMGIVPRSATSLVAALEVAGLVQRATDPTNRRSVLVTLTEQGSAIHRGMAAARARAGEEMFAALTDAERDQLAALLDKVGA